MSKYNDFIEEVVFENVGDFVSVQSVQTMPSKLNPESNTRLAFSLIFKSNVSYNEPVLCYIICITRMSSYE